MMSGSLIPHQTSVEVTPEPVRRRWWARRPAAGAVLLGAALLFGVAVDAVASAPKEEGSPAPVPRKPEVLQETTVFAAVPAKTPDVVYVPTPQPVVDKMLELVKPKKNDLVYDLGCGDGRIVVTAAKRFGTKAIGFDIDPVRVAEARENVKRNKVEHLVTIEERDIFTVDLSPANVVTLYLLPRLNVRLIPQLEKLKAGSRVVSHDFDMKGVQPERIVKVRPKGGDRDHTVYLFAVPLVKADPTTSGAETWPLVISP
jgi:SAM-dependent methyltransferase